MHFKEIYCANTIKYINRINQQLCNVIYCFITDCEQDCSQAKSMAFFTTMNPVGAKLEYRVACFCKWHDVKGWKRKQIAMNSIEWIYRRILPYSNITALVYQQQNTSGDLGNSSKEMESFLHISKTQLTVLVRLWILCEFLMWGEWEESAEDGSWTFGYSFPNLRCKKNSLP